MEIDANAIEYGFGVLNPAYRHITELFIEFYTQPKIGFRYSSHDEWRNAVVTLHDFGWATFDRS